MQMMTEHLPKLEIIKLADHVRTILAHDAAETLKNGGGDGTSGGMKARIARLESDVDYIKRDIGELKTEVREIIREISRMAYANFLWTISGFVGLFLLLGAGELGLAGLLAHGFGWLK
jgi:hypothetical protein